MITIRPSQLKLYSHCPGSYWLQQEVGEQPATEAMQRGTRIHELFAQYAYTKGWYAVWPDIKATYEEMNHIRSIWERYIKFGQDENHIEERLTLHAKNFALSGKPDVVLVNKSVGKLTHVEVIDWKTGAGMHLGMAEENLQLWGYALLVADAYRADSVTVRIVLVDADMDDHYTFNRVDIDGKISKAIQSIGDSVAFSKEFKLGFHCNEICNLRAHCPAWKTQAQELVKIEHTLPVTKEQIEKAAVLLPAAKKYLETVEEAVKAWVDVNGPIEHDGREYAKSTYMKFPELRMSLKNECDALDEETRLKVRKVLKGMEQVEVTKYSWRKKKTSE